MVNVHAQYMHACITNYGVGTYIGITPVIDFGSEERSHLFRILQYWFNCACFLLHGCKTSGHQ